MDPVIKSNKIYHGDCRDVLPQFPDGCIQAIITSAPYFGLRNYDLDYTMWGGQGNCNHDWFEQSNPRKGGKNRPENPPNVGANRHVQGTPIIREGAPTYFCSECGGWIGVLGLEPTPELYVEHIVEVFREVKRVLRDDGTVWLNIGDSYAGSPSGNPTWKNWSTGGVKDASTTYRPRSLVVGGLKPKDLIMIPFRVALALQADGWWVRSDIIWHKPNPMPESATDRPTTAHDHVFLLAKSKRYYYDADAIRESCSQNTHSRGKGGMPSLTLPKVTESGSEVKNNRSFQAAMCDLPAGYMRNKRTVWTIPTQPYPEAHFATFPEKLVEPCILAGSSPKACPECGAGWQRVIEKEGVATRPGRDSKYFDADGIDQIRGDTSGHLRHRVINIIKTTGWQPTCACENNDGSGSCIVLDPFAGSGTSCAVAKRLGRRWIGIEANRDYVKLAENRVAEAIYEPLLPIFE